MIPLGALLAAAAGTENAASPFESPAPAAAKNRIDELVEAKLAEKGVAPARLCSDEVFLRRAYLDAIGTLPTREEAQSFLEDGRPDKRARLVEALLGRDEFADYWALKWGDLLRVKSEFPINLWPNAAQAYHRWIRTAIASGMPYDEFVRELIVESGSNFRSPQVNFFRAAPSTEPEALARAVALTFMGARAEHWPEERLAGMAAFFSRLGFKETAEWKEEIVYFDLLGTEAAAAGKAVFPDGAPARIGPSQDPREVFADWLISPENPWFTRNIANRVWSWFMGRGIIHEPDDIRPDNPPSHPELLAWLESQLAGADYDLKHLYRLILNSSTYQRSSLPASEPSDAAAAAFASYPVRRLDAEVLIDAICQVTGATEEYSSLIPEPFTFIPGDERSIRLPDGSITSSFLEMFGRPTRDTGLETERSHLPNAAQKLHLLNSSHIRDKIVKSERLRRIAAEGRTPAEGVKFLYLAILSRPPTLEELKTIREYAENGGAQGPAAIGDIAWALINSAEFLCRH